MHDHPDYKAAMERIEESGVEPIDEETYNRYVELGQETADSSAVTTSAEEPADPRFLALHLFNLPSADAEQQLLAMLADFNQMLTDIGLPETRYNVWKVTGDQSGAYTYLFGSVWANRAAYDEAHEHPDYVAMQDEHREVYEALIPEEVYNRYVELRQE